MKEVLILGNEEAICYDLTQRMHSHGFKVRRTKNLRKAWRILKDSSPDFVICAGKIGLDAEGSYYIEF
ncbi:hypothetical protein DRP98_06375 [candidate division KSB1 bacterium]|nr:MAG: hypothetical protein B5M50_03900 [candidate division KSB1 bacterium 4484_219]RKY78571.1 MAG: hypothetical protein DRQ00_04975 [candidate division KSB1 bacterium]HDI52369.1 hypothetical protein [Bacteroidota bacterium]RKY78642.1 MAG: hypothetical protein DRQ12_05595 [candidate division KSB1 bacterium]RKY83794.1 MAG: hypothetical protein DRP98_06375 [candidate division KSB1 bacterium]